MSDKRRYTVTLEMANGNVTKFRIRDTQEKLNEVFAGVDKCWQSRDTDGFIALGGHYVRISAIVRYAFKRRYLW